MQSYKLCTCHQHLLVRPIVHKISKVYVGLDAHKESIALAQAAPNREPGRLLGDIAHEVNHLIKTLAPQGDPGPLAVSVPPLFKPIFLRIKDDAPVPKITALGETTVVQ